MGFACAVALAMMAVNFNTNNPASAANTVAFNQAAIDNANTVVPTTTGATIVNNGVFKPAGANGATFTVTFDANEVTGNTTKVVNGAGLNTDANFKQVPFEQAGVRAIQLIHMSAATDNAGAQAAYPLTATTTGARANFMPTGAEDYGATNNNQHCVAGATNSFGAFTVTT